MDQALQQPGLAGMTQVPTLDKDTVSKSTWGKMLQQVYEGRDLTTWKTDNLIISEFLRPERSLVPSPTRNAAAGLTKFMPYCWIWSQCRTKLLSAEDAVQIAAVRATALLADIRKERRRSLIGANSDEANRESLVSTDEMKMIKAFTGLRVGGRARGRGGRGRHGRGRGSGSF